MYAVLYLNGIAVCICIFLQLASTCMNHEEITELYSKQAGSLRTKGRYKDAERLAYCDIVAFRSDT